MAARGATIPSLEPIKISPHGRKSRAKRLLSSLPKSDLKRLVQKSPEVMVKVSGGGKTVQHVMAHLTYITRNGKLEALDDQTDKLAGKDAIQELMNEWGLDIAKGVGENKIVFNVVLSMPVGTDPQKLLRAAQHFARDEFFGDRQYLMVLHEPETDPSKKKAEHPHVHLVINAHGYSGQRLYIRKPMLQEWRKRFAGKLRDQGIEANATPRVVRGVVRKSKSIVVKETEKRRVAKVVEAKFEEIRKEVDNPNKKGNQWDRLAKIKRKQLERALVDVSTTLAKDGDQDLASALQEFKESLPPPITERAQMRSFVEAAKLARVSKNKELQPTAASRPVQEKLSNKDADKDSGMDNGR